MREASCSALTDFISGKEIEQLAPYIAELWERTFRVVDDSKESVRKAALGAVKALAGVTVRSLDPEGGRKDQSAKIVSIVVPFLCTKGLISEVEEVRLLAVDFLNKISKAAGVLLRPQLPVLIQALLEGLTNLEPAAFNYYTLHAEKQGMTAELEQARLHISKLSPLNDTLALCLDQVTSEGADGPTSSFLSPILL